MTPLKQQTSTDTSFNKKVIILISKLPKCRLLQVFTRHSLVRAKGEVFVLLYVCLFVCLFVRSTISQQPAGRFTPYFACGRSLGRDVSSLLLGVGGPRRAEKEANEIFVTMGVNGEFLHFGGMSDISATRARIHTKYYLCTDNVCRRAPYPCGIHRPLGAGGGGVKNSKNW